MKVRCIDNKNNVLFLTVGKVYEVLEFGNEAYKIENDFYGKSYYSKKCFEVVEEEDVDRRIYSVDDFNWEAFKRGRIAVWCETEELKKDFLLQCDNNGIMWGKSKPSDNTHIKCYADDNFSAYSFHYGNSFGISSYEWFQARGVKIIKWSIETYKGWEIIKMLSEGKLENGTILKDNEGFFYTVYNNCLLDEKHLKFEGYKKETKVSCLTEGSFIILEKEKFTTDIAYKKYIEGKEIKSCVTKNKYKKTEDNYFDSISKEEFEGLWYIEGR